MANSQVSPLRSRCALARVKFLLQKPKFSKTLKLKKQRKWSIKVTNTGALVRVRVRTSFEASHKFSHLGLRVAQIFPFGVKSRTNFPVWGSESHKISRLGFRVARNFPFRVQSCTNLHKFCRTKFPALPKQSSDIVPLERPWSGKERIIPYGKDSIQNSNQCGLSKYLLPILWGFSSFWLASLLVS